ncbi:hypothetical protein ABE438_17625 [Bosea sp. TWI1241]|uniref:hypothetical protein n=1 Tax=Bosea sp. TWI1241 TaxID=3148904 RepID=UPI003208E07D
MELTRADRDCIEHALGLTRARRPFRNFFAAEPGSPDHTVFMRLASRGLATLHRRAGPGQPCDLYAVTEAGQRAVGVTPPFKGAGA